MTDFEFFKLPEHFYLPKKFFALKRYQIISTDFEHFLSQNNFWLWNVYWVVKYFHMRYCFCNLKCFPTSNNYFNILLIFLKRLRLFLPLWKIFSFLIYLWNLHVSCWKLLSFLLFFGKCLNYQPDRKIFSFSVNIYYIIK